MIYIKSNDNSYTVVINNKMYDFSSDHLAHDKLVEAIANDDEKMFVSHYSTEDAFHSWSEGNFVLVDDQIIYDGEPLVQVISDRVIEMIQDKFDVVPMLNFIEKLYSSGDFRVVNELFNFMLHKHLPITKDGNLIAWKGVQEYTGPDFVDYAGRTVTAGDLVDCWTGRIRNNPGDTNRMPRHQVENDPRNPCGPGFHCGEIGYAEGWAKDAILMVEINPADVVSIPEDSSCKKMRCCEQTIVSIFNDRREEIAGMKSVVDTSNIDEDFIIGEDVE